MSGTAIGGKFAAETNKKRHGEDFYARIGKIGGSNGNTGGFAANHKLAALAGAKGGKKSKRKPREQCIRCHNKFWKRDLVSIDNIMLCDECYSIVNLI